MRNIVKYPMTYDEAECILDTFKDSCDKNLIGDIRPYAIEWVKEKLREHKEMTKCDI